MEGSDDLEYRSSPLGMRNWPDLEASVHNISPPSYLGHVSFESPGSPYASVANITPPSYLGHVSFGSPGSHYAGLEDTSPPPYFDHVSYESSGSPYEGVDDISLPESVDGWDEPMADGATSSPPRPHYWPHPRATSTPIKPRRLRPAITTDYTPPSRLYSPWRRIRLRKRSPTALDAGWFPQYSLESVIVPNPSYNAPTVRYHPALDQGMRYIAPGDRRRRRKTYCPGERTFERLLSARQPRPKPRPPLPEIPRDFLRPLRLEERKRRMTAQRDALTARRSVLFKDDLLLSSPAHERAIARHRVLFKEDGHRRTPPPKQEDVEPAWVYYDAPTPAMTAARFEEDQRRWAKLRDDPYFCIGKGLQQRDLPPRLSESSERQIDHAYRVINAQPVPADAVSFETLLKSDYCPVRQGIYLKPQRRAVSSGAASAVHVRDGADSETCCSIDHSYEISSDEPLAFLDRGRYRSHLPAVSGSAERQMDRTWRVMNAQPTPAGALSFETLLKSDYCPIRDGIYLTSEPYTSPPRVERSLPRWSAYLANCDDLGSIDHSNEISGDEPFAFLDRGHYRRHMIPLSDSLEREEERLFREMNAQPAPVDAVSFETLLMSEYCPVRDGIYLKPEYVPAFPALVGLTAGLYDSDEQEGPKPLYEVPAGPHKRTCPRMEPFTMKPKYRYYVDDTRLRIAQRRHEMKHAKYVREPEPEPELASVSMPIETSVSEVSVSTGYHSF